MIVDLKDYTVELKDEMTWGDSQKIEEALLSSAKMKGSQTSEFNFDFDGTAVTKIKYVTIELMIKEIKKGDVIVKYSKDWLDNLSVADGDKLYSAVEELTKKK